MPLSDPKSWWMLRDWALPHRREHDPKSNPPRWCTRIDHNLIRADGWNEESGGRIVFEYRRFLYLKLLDGGLLTPPGCIDKLWHLHMELAGEGSDVLTLPDGRVIHHHAIVSEADSLASYRRCVAQYAEEFGSLPPGDIWPDPDFFRNRTLRHVRARRLGWAGTVAMGLCIGSALTLAVFEGGVLALVGLPLDVAWAVAGLGLGLWAASLGVAPPWIPEPQRLKVASCG